MLPPRIGDLGLRGLWDLKLDPDHTGWLVGAGGWLLGSVRAIASVWALVGGGSVGTHPDGAGHGVPQAQAVGAAAAQGRFLSGIREAPVFCVVPLCLTAAGCFVLFIYGDALYRLLEPMVGR